MQPGGAGGRISDNRDQPQHGIEAEFHAQQAEPGIEQPGKRIQRGKFLADGAPMRQYHGADFLVGSFPGHLSLPQRPESLPQLPARAKPAE